MKDRIKAIRKETKLSQTDFGRAVGVTLSAVQKWELGISVPSDAAIMNIGSKFGINEVWIRTGEGTMHSDTGVASEMSSLVDQLFRNRPESFKARLISALLRYEPDGPQWKVLEEIYRTVAAESEVPEDEASALHEELDRQIALEKKESTAL